MCLRSASVSSVLPRFDLKIVKKMVSLRRANKKNKWYLRVCGYRRSQVGGTCGEGKCLIAETVQTTIEQHLW